MKSDINDLCEAFLAALTNAGYAVKSIENYKQVSNRFKKFCAENGYDTYTVNIGQIFADNVFNEETGAFVGYRNVMYGRFVRLINSFYLQGTFDFSMVTKEKNLPKSIHLIEIYQDYMEHLKTQYSNIGTIGFFQNGMLHLLRYMEDGGILTLKDLAVSDVVNYICSWSQKHQYSGNPEHTFTMEEKKMLMNSNEYLNIVESIKQDIRTAQYRATVSVNRELLVLYHSIGEVINEHKTWGNKFVENLAADIKISFPDATGYSVRNLKYMAKFAVAYPDDEFVQQPVAQIPWGTISLCWTSSLITKNVSGTQRKSQRTAGRATCWFTKSKVDCISGKCWQRRYLTLKAVYRLHRVNSRPKR